MTTTITAATATHTAKVRPPAIRPEDIRLPDPPDRTPDMTTYDHLSRNGNAHYLWEHFGSHDTTLVEGERYISPAPATSMAGLRYPDLLIAFGVSWDAYHRHNGYIISEQGKPPDFVLEIASRSTADTDTGAKRHDYAALAIPEYWRFDATGEYHGTRLAGDRLTAGAYHPIRIDELEEGILQGYSPILNLNLRWAHGQLEWHDPATGLHIVTLTSERHRADAAEHRADAAEHRADAAEHQADQERSRADRERSRADAAEHRVASERSRADAAQAAHLSSAARIQELEAELRRRDA